MYSSLEAEKYFNKQLIKIKFSQVTFEESDPILTPAAFKY
jgi:hypothetical protein